MKRIQVIVDIDSGVIDDIYAYESREGALAKFHELTNFQYIDKENPYSAYWDDPEKDDDHDIKWYRTPIQP